MSNAHNEPDTISGKVTRAVRPLSSMTLALEFSYAFHMILIIQKRPDDSFNSLRKLNFLLRDFLCRCTFLFRSR